MDKRISERKRVRIAWIVAHARFMCVCTCVCAYVYACEREYLSFRKSPTSALDFSEVKKVKEV